MPQPMAGLPPPTAQGHGSISRHGGDHRGGRALGRAAGGQPAIRRPGASRRASPPHAVDWPDPFIRSTSQGEGVGLWGGRSGMPPVSNQYHQSDRDRSISACAHRYRLRVRSTWGHRGHCPSPRPACPPTGSLMPTCQPKPPVSTGPLGWMIVWVLAPGHPCIGLGGGSIAWGAAANAHQPHEGGVVGRGNPVHRDDRTGG